MKRSVHHTDIADRGWIVRMPAAIRPYLYLMRLDRPIGSWLLLLPGWWALALTGAPWHYYALFAVGALIMRGAGCIVNDLWDRDLDRLVERTRARPLASGALSLRHALGLLAVLLCVGLVILTRFNGLTIALGVLSLLFIVLYPLMKRITWWPQAFLGLTFNFGALMGWSAAAGTLPWQAWVLYAAGFFWTLGYDTLYALQDREDDALAGIRSTARLFLERWKVDPRWPVGAFYAVHWCGLAAVLVSLSGYAFLPVLALPGLHLAWQAAGARSHDPADALRRFRSNRDYALTVFAVFILAG